MAVQHSALNRDRKGEAIATVTDLIMDAYNVEQNQIEKAPTWAATGGELYDIEARIPDGTFTLDEVRIMLQNLLAERFQLRVHKQLTDAPVYVLKVAPGGHKMKVADEERFNGMELVRATLGFMLPEPLLDETGLTGRFAWTFDIDTLSRERSENLFPPPSLFGIVERDLGLKLEHTKRPRERIVIDHVERPSAN